MSILRERIAYISDQRFPVEKADAEQVVNTVSALCQQGVAVDLVIPGHWWRSRQQNPQRAREIADFFHIEHNFQVRSLRHFPMSKLRLEKYAHGILAPIYARSRGYDMVYTRNPMSAFFAMRFGLPVVFETYRIYNLSPVTKAFVKWVCRRQWLAVICHSRPSRDSLIWLGLADYKLAVIHNGYNPALFTPPLSKTEARRRLALDLKQKMVTYSGRLDREKGITMLLRLAADTPEIQYYLIGKTQKNHHNWIRTEADKMRLRNINLIEWQPLKDLAVYLLASDLLVIPPTAAPMLKYGKTVLPLKLFIYLAAGRPILAPQQADSTEILSHENALLVPPEDVTAAVEMMRCFFAKPTSQQDLCTRAKHDAQQYTWQNRAHRIIEFLNACLEK